MPYACVADGDSGLRVINIMPSGASRFTVFSDDFEDELAGWQESGDVEWYTGEPKNETHAVRLRTDASIQQTISTVGFEDIGVSFYLGISGLDVAPDHVSVDWHDGDEWNPLLEIEAGDLLEDRLYYFQESLGADADDNPDFTLRLAIYCSGPASSAYVDDVAVAGNPILGPYEVGFYNTPGQARGVAVVGDRAYVADGDAGVRAIDISQPSQPIEIGYFDTLGWAESVAAVGSLALVADGENGLLLVDFSTPSAPVEVAYYQTHGWAADVAVLEKCAYVADTGWGLDILALWDDFFDVPFYHWAYRQIKACLDTEITLGYPDGLYHPEFTVSRAQMAVFIARAHAGGEDNIPPYTGYSRFADVPFDHWAYDHVEYCYAHGIVTGYPDGLYHPLDVVKRDTMAVFMARARGWVSIGDDMKIDVAVFPDVPAEFWAGTAIQACVANGVVLGYPDGLYRPYLNISRDQMAVFVSRAFDLTS